MTIERYNDNDSGKGHLTDRQEQVLEIIRQAVEEKGYPPTVRDIAQGLRIISLNAVRHHLQALEKKGYIKVDPCKSRGINLLESPASGNRAAIPLVGRIAAGPLSAAMEDVEGSVVIDPEMWGNTDDLFLLKVRGDSMEPHIKEGDLVVVRRQPYADQGEVVVALVEDEATVKQLLMVNGSYLLHPFNPAYDDITTEDGFSINGTVVGLIRKYR